MKRATEGFGSDLLFLLQARTSDFSGSFRTDQRCHPVRSHLLLSFIPQCIFNAVIHNHGKTFVFASLLTDRPLFHSLSTSSAWPLIHRSAYWRLLLLAVELYDTIQSLLPLLCGCRDQISPGRRFNLDQQ